MSIATEITALNNNLAAAKSAVTTKGGTVGDTGLAGLATEIASIPAGGSAPVEKDVNFFDYDGTLIAGYTIAEAHVLSELPTPPVHAEFTFEGWTETLASVKATANPLDIGATYSYTANRDATVFAFRPGEGETITLKFIQNVADGVTINWGDGSATETVASTGNVSASHTYTSVAMQNIPYKITLVPNDGTTLTLGQSQSQSKTFVTATTAGLQLKADYLIAGKANVYGVGYLSRLESLLFSPQALLNSSVGMTNLLSTRTIIINAQNFGSDSFNPSFASGYGLRCYIISSLANVAFPSMGSFGGNSALRNFMLPKVPTAQSMVSNYVMEKLFVPSSITTFVGGLLYNCYGLKKITFEDRVSLPSTIGQSWYNIGSSTTVVAPDTLDFSSFTQVPTLEDASAFLGNLPAYVKILVPSSLATSWKAASGWSDYANQIVGV